jgi:hypothetical protein
MFPDITGMNYGIMETVVVLGGCLFIFNAMVYYSSHLNSMSLHKINFNIYKTHFKIVTKRTYG